MRQVHRDLKPANIMLTASGLCKISDFGISKQLEETRSVAMTQVGTTMYMAPERFRGDTYSYPSDVWAVGVITLEALTGHHPFEGIKQFLSLQAAICEQPSPRAPVGAPAGLIEFVAGCLRKDSAVGKDGRPDVRQLVSGAWLRPHSLGDPAYMTMCYLQSVGLLTPSNGYTTAPTTAPSDPSAAAAAGAASPPPTLPLAPVAPASMDDDDL
jgi:serine/threonine protein kinase